MKILSLLISFVSSILQALVAHKVKVAVAQTQEVDAAKAVTDKDLSSLSQTIEDLKDIHNSPPMMDLRDTIKDLTDLEASLKAQRANQDIGRQRLKDEDKKLGL